jgi:hypothetical protein
MKTGMGRLPATILVGFGILVGILFAQAWSAYGAGAPSQGSLMRSIDAQANCQTFSQTGHKVCGKFLDYWNRHGGLAQQGYPLSEEFTETSDLDGKPYTVQYFERAVFESHPENQPPNDVLLSQLGTYLGKAKYTKGFPATAGQEPFYEDRTDPVAALLSFYNAIDRKEYDRAYSYFQGAPSPNPSLVAPYDQWVKGYADTASVTVAAGKPVQDIGAGNIYAAFPVVLTSSHMDGTTQLFSGCYIMHRANAGISPNPNDELWSINAATLSPAPANASVDQLLSQTCSR